MTPFLLDWANLGLRWLHLITGIAWIGSSFYFVALDMALRKRQGLPAGVHGEEWQVHGGGFYHMMKYNVAPDHMPEHLTWFKWEAYTTWISGFILLVVMYYFGAELYMIDHDGWALPGWATGLIGIATLGLGWVAYDRLCKSKLGQDIRVPIAAALVGLPLLLVALDLVLASRGAFFHIGSLIGTVMVANVFFVIIPNQKKVVASLKAGETPDPALGQQAKQRSMHNSYLTLPVLFIMISGHYPQLYATPLNWLIVGLVLVTGAAIRHWFIVSHTDQPKPKWAIAVAVAGAIALVTAASVPATAAGSLASIFPDAYAAGVEGEVSEGEVVPVADQAEAEPAALTFEDVSFEAINTVMANCSMCHAREPLWEGMTHAPKGVYLETPEEIERRAHDVWLNAYVSHSMPPGNITYMDEETRRLINVWYQGLRNGGDVEGLIGGQG